MGFADSWIATDATTIALTWNGLLVALYVGSAELLFPLIASVANSLYVPAVFAARSGNTAATTPPVLTGICVNVPVRTPVTGFPSESRSEIVIGTPNG